MVYADLMADPFPSTDHLPTWLTVALSVITTIAGWKGLGPVAKWAGRRLDLIQQARVAERADLVRQLTGELKAAREEMVELRLAVGQERERRMALATDNATLTERVDGLTKAMADDKRDCQRAIRALQAEIRELRRAAQHTLEGPP